MTHRLPRRTLPALLLAACALLLSAATLAQSARAAAKVFVRAAGGGAVYRPATLALSPHQKLTGIRWKAYGGAKATGPATCTVHHFHEDKDEWQEHVLAVTVHASTIKRVKGKQVYTKVKTTFRSGPAAGLPTACKLA